MLKRDFMVDNLPGCRLQKKHEHRSLLTDSFWKLFLSVILESYVTEKAAGCGG